MPDAVAHGVVVRAEIDRQLQVDLRDRQARIQPVIDPVFLQIEHRVFIVDRISRPLMSDQPAVIRFAVRPEPFQVGAEYIRKVFLPLFVFAFVLS